MTLARGKPLERRTPLTASKGIERTEWKRKPPKTKKAKRTRSPNDFSDEVKANVRRRSGNRCEIRVEGVCTGTATRFHHRKLRGRPSPGTGRHGDNREVNCLHGCDECHVHVHANPGKSYLMGWLVRTEMDPLRVPAKYGGATVP